jgi:hypothetical protein
MCRTNKIHQIKLKSCRLCEISGAHGGEDDVVPLGCDTIVTVEDGKVCFSETSISTYESTRVTTQNVVLKFIFRIPACWYKRAIAEFTYVILKL